MGNNFIRFQKRWKCYLYTSAKKKHLQMYLKWLLCVESWAKNWGSYHLSSTKNDFVHHPHVQIRMPITYSLRGTWATGPCSPGSAELCPWRTRSGNGLWHCRYKGHWTVWSFSTGSIFQSDWGHRTPGIQDDRLNAWQILKERLAENLPLKCPYNWFTLFINEKCNDRFLSWSGSTLTYLLVFC